MDEHRDPIASFFAYTQEDVEVYGEAHNIYFALWQFAQSLRNRRKYTDEDVETVCSIEREFYDLFGHYLED